MKVIGHRGAASLAPENSIAGIKLAKKVGVDAIEFDVRLSRDGELFLCHDPTLSRTHDVDEHIGSLTSSEIRKIRGKQGDHVPDLNEALSACGDTPVYIEAKASRWARPLAKALSTHPQKHLYTVIAFNHHELFAFSQLCPEVPVLVLEQRNSFDAINAARVYGFTGIDVNYWTLNPLAYYLAKRHGLQMAVFTVDKPWVAKLFKKLYPGVAITTNVPQDMQLLRANKPKKK